MSVRPALSVAVSIALLAASSATSLRAQGDARTERVQFKKGASSATVTGTIKGYQTVSYLVGARKGQSLNVSLATKHGATQFNILAPGKTDGALNLGSSSDRQYEGTLPATGDYRIEVYMMRSAARRNETSNFRLEISISGRSPSAASASSDAIVPGTNYHATGSIPCSMGDGQPSTRCKLGVRRGSGGSGSVTVTRPDGRTRIITFVGGRATGADVSQADGGEFRAAREGDLTMVRIGGERYEIPDAVIFGG